MPLSKAHHISIDIRDNQIPVCADYLIFKYILDFFILYTSLLINSSVR